MAVDYLVGENTGLMEIIWTGPANGRFPVRRIDQLLYDFMGAYVNLVVGPQTWTYQHLTSDPGTLFEILKQMNLLPCPAGVTLSVAEVGAF